MEKQSESEKDTQLLCSASAKEVENVQLLNVQMHSTIVKAKLQPYIFSSFPHDPQRLIAGVT